MPATEQDLDDVCRRSMMRHRCQLVAGLLLGVLGLNSQVSDAKPAAEPNVEITVAGRTSSLTLRQLQSELKVATVEIDDPVYQSRKSFDGFLLNDVLKLVERDVNLGGDEVVVFVAADEYEVNTPTSNLRDHTAYLVFQEHATLQVFGKVSNGKEMVSPAPFYVVWSEGRALEHAVPWPFQLAKIKVVGFAQYYPKVLPTGAQVDSKAVRGFATFKNACMGCHSINLQGGAVGPELNIPRNITEYWDEGVLKAFIADAASFRAKSKMPPFKHLKAAEIDELIAYLTHMKELKSP